MNLFKLYRLLHICVKQHARHIFCFSLLALPYFSIAHVTIDSVNNRILSKQLHRKLAQSALPLRRDGGSINLVRAENVTHFNPFSEDINLASSWNMCFDSLFVADDFTYGLYQSLIASDLALSTDKTTLSVTIHAQARFANGMPIVSDDVIASIDYFRHKGQLALQLPRSLDLSLKKISDDQLQIKSKHPMSIAQVIFLMQLPITQAQSLHDGHAPIASGAYQVTSLKPNQYAILQKNPDYWAQKLPVRFGMFHFHKVKFIFVKSLLAGFQLFVRGSADFHWEPFYENFEQLIRISKRDPALKRMLIPTRRSIGMQGLVFNQHKNIWQNPVMRQALSFAFDFDRLNRRLFNQQYTRLESLFTHTPYASPIKQDFPYDLNRADSLLSSQGWISENGRRIHQQTKQVLSVKILVNSIQNEKIANIYAKNLQQLGIKTLIRRFDAADYVYQLQSRDFDLAYFYLPIAQTLPSDFVRDLPESSVKPYSFGQLFGTRDPLISASITKLNESLAAPYKLKTIQKIDHAMMQSHAIIPFWYPSFDRLAYWQSIDGPIIPMQCRPRDNFRYWWSAASQS